MCIRDRNSQLAAFMVKYFPDKEMKEKIRQLIKTDALDSIDNPLVNLIRELIQVDTQCTSQLAD